MPTAFAACNELYIKLDKKWNKGSVRNHIQKSYHIFLIVGNEDTEWANFAR